MKRIILCALLISIKSLLAQDESEYFVEDSFSMGKFPIVNYFELIKGGIDTSTDWSGISRNGSLLFYDDYLDEFKGDTLPCSIDSLQDLTDCRMRYSVYQVLRTNEAWFIGASRGEWGGTLYKLSADLKECIIVCRGNINQLLNYEDRIFVVEGLSHLGSKSGNILEVRSDLTIDTLMTFNETPQSMTLDSSGNGFLLTNTRIYSINSEMDTVCLYTNETWNALYASNLLKTDNNLYITMRGGIAKYFIREKEMKWLTRN